MREAAVAAGLVAAAVGLVWVARVVARRAVRAAGDPVISELLRLNRARYLFDDYDAVLAARALHRAAGRRFDAAQAELARVTPGPRKVGAK